LYYDAFLNLIELSQSHNGWFTPEQVYFAIQSWAEALTEEHLDEWLSGYDFSNLNLVYNTNDFKISSPYVSYKNNTSYFALDDENNYYLKINKNTGEIIVNTSLLIGHYNYVINYSKIHSYCELWQFMVHL
jgi:hypothetical protein